MSRWFRFYDEAVNDPKIIKLSDDIFRAWVNLLCVASKNDGNLPATDDIAIILRVKVARAAAIIAELVSFGLLDRTETGFAPHNWNGRQYKSDVSTERVKRFRNGKRNVSETPPDTEQIQTTEHLDKIGEARASHFTEGSKALTAALWKALGHESALSIPPELAGADWRAIEWDRAGWTVDLIDTEARRVGPGKPLSYYEKCFATSFAKRQAPLPVVKIREAEKLTVTHGTSQNKSVSAVAKRWAEQFESQSGGGVEGNPVSILRISQG